ncbi:uncharacterized protein UTRI_06193_B [Ustilago trichophora]|uniref:Uncharacterized protein n=1 Tax=Ustilago trichophora TaxID=86804 RepID=A0A5C3EGV5_9BASI|nr:uncharacterized protein UTRI_06193_B [Ustilago trichophora]
MISLSLALVLFISSLLHTTCHAVDRTPDIGRFLGNQAPLDWASTDRANTYVENLATYLRVPPDHLQPAHLYNPVTDDALIMDHFRNRDSRFALTHSHGQFRYSPPRGRSSVQERGEGSEGRSFSSFRPLDILDQLCMPAFGRAFCQEVTLALQNT